MTLVIVMLLIQLLLPATSSLSAPVTMPAVTNDVHL
jgi:hypothetical protein